MIAREQAHSKYLSRTLSLSQYLSGRAVMQRTAVSTSAARCTPLRAAPLKVGNRRVAIVTRAAQKAEYIWYDGFEGVEEKGLTFNEMRSKTKVMEEEVTSMKAEDFPDWSYDGSSTGQAEGNFSDCILRPVYVTNDPIRGENSVLVLCMVMAPDGKAHETNHRQALMDIIDDEISAQEPMYGFEQEYTMMQGSYPYGWPQGGIHYPAPQGPFYCGVGAQSVYGRPLAEAHLDACMKCGLKISGINAEVMPGQWEFQIGPAGALEMPDQVMIARWLLYRLGENWGISPTLQPKPVRGDWNGAGAHTNFSTKDMRKEGGMDAINAAIAKMEKTHMEHITQYGLGNENRLTGKHETADMNTFSSGAGDRGASVRIPLPVQLKGYGYLEDRRPSANVNPYIVSRLLLKTTFSR